MPEISRFLGIIIRMQFNDHPPPHFHVQSGGKTAMVSIRSLRLLEGDLSPRVLGLVAEWAALHREELLLDWDLAMKHQPLNRIDPLV